MYKRQALYDHEGKLIASEPVALEKKNVQVQTQEWYENAENAIENVHFSTPHIQELFEDGAYRYQWVVSLSSYVEDVYKRQLQHLQPQQKKQKQQQKQQQKLQILLHQQMQL